MAYGVWHVLKSVRRFGCPVVRLYTGKTVRLYPPEAGSVIRVFGYDVSQWGRGREVAITKKESVGGKVNRGGQLVLPIGFRPWINVGPACT